jgi:hypothetical protein
MRSKDHRQTADAGNKKQSTVALAEEQRRLQPMQSTMQSIQQACDPTGLRSNKPTLGSAALTFGRARSTQPPPAVGPL